VCWDGFVDEQTPIVRMSYQVLQFVGDRQGSVRDTPVTQPTPVAPGVDSLIISGLQLQVCSAAYA
jgi:hypothetical protein